MAMSDADSLLLELRHMRAQVDGLADDMAAVKERLSNLEHRQAAVELAMVGFNGELAVVHQRMDLIEQRLKRIESHLNLVDTP